ncbi:DNA polymerase III subunit gamma/tau [Anaerococcus sp. AGMB09787]|uniref:DNA polymerase III subunit gamma/tau n=1 Tax=Anaerococcus sp. AGMB09787 TaxID=2922869 RepID=UPI001FAF7AE8|nr:DNA polymerase III subunit gamma/tau [Anaerococcus sp. AGMB09787]
MAKALYRQYRPKTFDEVLGQDRVVNVLKNQVKNKNFSHAYIFAGERGTGKTTCAKIFAKAINCLNPKDGSPCLKCDNCRSIDEEATIDIIEMDAASNRRIDDIRNLKDNVIYPPNNLKYKVYIIDEAHMITREAFNALLKIMEEPPSHLVFILATTEIEKIPNTILSRVQKFEFNKINSKDIKKQINIILQDKNITMENEAIDLIIRKAKGAMRDALSILDQVISTEESSYSLPDVENLLGTVDFYDIDSLTKSIFAYNQKGAIDKVFSLRDHNKSNKDIVEALASYMRDIMLYKLTGDKVDFENEDRADFIEERSREIDLDRLIDILDLVGDYEIKLKNTDNTDLITELMVIRLINSKDINSLDGRIRALEGKNEINLVELVNKAIEDKLSNIDFSDKYISKRPSKENEYDKYPSIINLEEDTYDTEEIENIEDSIPEKITTDVPKEEEAKNEEALTPEIKEEPASSWTELSTYQIDDIKEMFVATAGRSLKGMFESEGFNYSFDGHNFTLYLKDSFYGIFIQTKIEEITIKLSEIIGSEVYFETDDFENYQKKTPNLGKEGTIKEKDLVEEVNESDNIDENEEKLREILGDLLIVK